MCSSEEPQRVKCDFGFLSTLLGQCIMHVLIYLFIYFFQDVSEGDLITKATNMKNNGNNLLKDAKNAAKDLKGVCEFNKNITL